MKEVLRCLVAIVMCMPLVGIVIDKCMLIKERPTTCPTSSVIQPPTALMLRGGGFGSFRDGRLDKFEDPKGDEMEIARVEEKQEFDPFQAQDDIERRALQKLSGEMREPSARRARSVSKYRGQRER
jgi:hypothetical protein